MRFHLSRAALWALLLLNGGERLAAHDIVADVKVQAYVKPSGQLLAIVIRVPLKALRDVEFPTLPSQKYLDIDHAEPSLRNAATKWIVNAMELRQGNAVLATPRLVAVQAAAESDRSFVSYQEVVAHVTGPPLANSANLPVDQAVLDLMLEYPLPSPNAELSIRTHLEGLGQKVVTVLWFLPQGGTIRAFEYLGDAGLIRLDPRWHQAALRFVDLGFHHILDGIDHLLFLFCLVIPVRKFRTLLWIVTAFTVAHSITLIASAFGFAPSALWFPPWIEVLIATSIVYMALENIVNAAGDRQAGLQRRWMITFGFGLVHGFGFSFALHETLQFAGSHLVTSLLAFNVGVELGQLLVLALLVPLLWLLFKYLVAERVGTIILSVLVAHTGWHWLIERWDVLRQFHLL